MLFHDSSPSVSSILDSSIADMREHAAAMPSRVNRFAAFAASQVCYDFNVHELWRVGKPLDDGGMAADKAGEPFCREGIRP
jgi:hypothetical protein